MREVTNGADALVRCLEEEGVSVVFGYPGVAIAPFFDSILDTDIRTVLVRQEQNAAHAASGYARSTGKTGVVAVTSGPGATNLITGIATAFADSIPMVCITGQVDSRLMGNDVFQEADISGACESFVKYSYIIRDPKDIPRVMKEAFYIAGTGRKGPVLVDVPFDIQTASPGRFKYPETVSMRTYKPTVRGHAQQIKRVISELKKAKRPILCAGGGVHLAGAAEEVRLFAENHHFPVVSTMMGLGVMPTDHPMYFGMVGNNGQPYSNAAMNNADLIMMVGARVADRSVNQPDLVMDGKVLIHIDVDPAEIGKIAGATIPLVGDAEKIFADFAAAEFDADYSRWTNALVREREDYRAAKQQRLEEKAVKEGTVSPEKLIRSLSLAMDEDAVYVADVGQNQMWSCANCVIREGKFFTSGGMGTMGYSLPAAMGASYAAPGRQVVCVCGDGGFQMTMMELGTLHQYGIPVKTVVLRNHSLGLVRQYQRLNYGGRYSVTDLDESPDLEKLAAAYSLPYYRISSAESMEETLAAFLHTEGSALLECMIDPDAVS